MSGAAGKSAPYVTRFADVLTEEHAAIDARRKLNGRPPVQTCAPAENRKGVGNTPAYDTTGIALSGGGIRSASFCLGVLQALAVRGKIKCADYLSTVSGGGYIGSSVSAAMSEAPPPGSPTTPFPFAAPGKFEDTESVAHLRDYSNYILPRGHQSLVDAIAVVARGLAANFIFVTGALLMLCWTTVAGYPDTPLLLKGSFLPSLADGLLGWFMGQFGSWMPFSFNGILGRIPFALTLWLFAAQLFFMCCWAVWRSIDETPGSDVTGVMVRIGRVLLIVLVFNAFLDVQPLAIAGLLSLARWADLGAKPEWVTGTTAALTAISGAAAFFRDKLAALTGTATQNAGVSDTIKRLLAKATIYLAALALPLLLWLVYLTLCLAGMAMDYGVVGQVALRPGVEALAAPLHIHLTAPFLYLIGGIVVSMIASLLSANANSLHRLYRDKLSKAFLFDPLTRETPDPRSDLKALDDKPLPQIAPPTGGPYQLVNTAINLQGSIYANRRGRNASFFFFSALFSGGDATGYVRTQYLQNADRNINLGTAMAISGAAVSSNMGSNSIAAMAPTLALLNVRLGYWLINPRFALRSSTFASLAAVARTLSMNLVHGMKSFYVAPGVLSDVGQFAALHVRNLRRILARVFKSYLLQEMMGQLDETKPYVYLTDGGHIENLGLYELLRRQCRAIVVVDGEQDGDMAFPSLCKLERYARIDLGVLIDLPWEEIATVTTAVTEAIRAGTPFEPRSGPHCALGIIHYPNGCDGLLLYVKSSLTGDEPDYIMNYKRRVPEFPHESTGDQFFSEEQFENYRALGYHAIDGFLAASHRFLFRSEGPWGPQASPEQVRDYFLARFC